MPSENSVLNILDATPTWLRIPMPMAETLETLASPMMSDAPISPLT